MTMTPYRILSLTGLLLITACNGGAAPIDSKSYLNELDGPKVKGVSDALAQAATAAEQQGNFRVAAQNYEQMLEKKPGDKDLMLSLADSLRRDGQSARAVTVYDALLAADPKNIAAKEGKGLALIASGDFDSPAALFDEVMAADPTRWKTLNALGILFTTRNMQPEAQQYFKEALKYHASSPSIMNNLGLSQALERNFDGAIGTLSQASATAQPGTLERKRIDLNTALVLASAGKLDDARMLAEQYLAGAELDNNLGLYAHLAKDDQMARAYLNKALSDSKVYYAKAWDNLEEINKTSTTPDKKTDKKTAEKKADKKPDEKKVADKKTPEKPATKADAASAVISPAQAPALAPAASAEPAAPAAAPAIMADTAQPPAATPTQFVPPAVAPAVATPVTPAAAAQPVPAPTATTPQGFAPPPVSAPQPAATSAATATATQ